MATKEQVAAVKREGELIEVLRKAKLAAWNDYVGFAVSRGAGVASILCGALDIVRPNLIPNIPHPEYLLGGGLALLTGKTMVNQISKILEVFK